MIALKVGIRIKTLRLNRGLTQEKLGELSGLEYKHIQLLESRKAPNARIDTIYSIARGLGTSLAEFFSDELFQEKPKESIKKNNFLKAKSKSERKVIFENAYWYAEYHNPPLSRGHTVIYAKRDVQNYFELYPEENYALIEMERKVYNFLLIEFKPDGFNVGTNIGFCAGQECNTVAMHIIPRYKGDSRNPLLTGMRRVVEP
ncbi:MAG: HIT domain-containing protein [Leptospiraceae bacterium]|nr:HIT domain-containing protein [Leptospiraceae bacterium]